MYSNTQNSVDYSLEKQFEYIYLTATLLSIILPRTFVFCTPLYILKSDMYKHIYTQICVPILYLHKSSCSVTNNKNYENSENKTSTEQSTLP